MPREKEGFVRKVFMLPADLVERIAGYQRQAQLTSEVEAVRRLLEEALKYRDDWWSLTQRFREQLASVRSLSEAARETLVGHPLITNIAFNRDSLEFTLSSGETVTASATGEIAIFRSGKPLLDAPKFEFDEDGTVKNSYLPF
ncbi:hypothetical protein GR247_12800 [Rhizobium leguminosarum]|nr:hypothetical protein [Rhizobium leguminosarum]